MNQLLRIPFRLYDRYPSDQACERRVKNPRIALGPTVWDAIGDLPNLDDYELLLETDAIRLSEAEARGGEQKASSYAARARGLQRDADDRSYPRKVDRRLLTSSTRTVHIPRSIERFRATTPGATEPISRFYRLHPNGLCNTLRAGTGSERGAYTSPRPIHPKRPRVISVREAARLHSFPDWFRLHATKWHGFRQIGNAVAPFVGAAVGREIRRALGVDPAVPKRALALGDEELLSLQMAAAGELFGADPDYMPAARARREQPVRVAA